jgi:hypothetical protein
LLIRVIVPEVPGEPRPALLCCSIPAIPWLGAGIGEALIFVDVFAAGAVMLAAGFAVECLTNLRQP